MVFKTRIKRSELLFNIIILALFAVVASVQLLSAYGASCVAYDPSYWAREVVASGFPFPPGFILTVMFPYMAEFGMLFQVMNVFTWILAFAWGFLLYAYFTKWPWKRIFIAGLIISALGFVSGLIPALIADTNGFSFLEWSAGSPFVPVQDWVTFEFEIGSPHWGRTMGNALMFFIFIVMNFVPAFKKATKKFVEVSDVAGRYVKQLIVMSLFFFWLGAASFLGTSFMADAHVVGGVNVWQTIELQFLGGVITSLIGASMLSTALIYNLVRPSPALIAIK